MRSDAIADKEQHLENLARLKAASRTRNLKWYSSRYLLDLARGLVRRKRPNRNKTSYRLPATRGLDRNFIRQEPWEIEYLYMLAHRAKKGILEIGRYNGGSAVIFALANKSVPIWSVDLEPKDDDHLKALFGELGCGSNVRLIVGDSQNTKYPQIELVDLLFVDGDHSYEGCMRDLENWWDTVAIGGHIVLHDSYFGIQSQQAAIDFCESHPVDIVVSPYKINEYWRLPDGSLCHLIKRSRA
jgi:predicted O-methyltransferase YrrM